MERTLSILVVDDETVQRETLAHILSDHGYQVQTAHDLASAVEVLRRGPVDVVLTDFRMPGGTGLDVARQVSALCSEAVTILMTAYADVAGVIDAMRAGVLDYLLKPLNVPALLSRFDILRERKGLRQEVAWLRAEVDRTAARSRGGLLGETPAIEEVRRLIGQVAETRGTVLLTGESGTGKEVVAREIHRSSRDAARQFVAINCGAIPENLLESELFGHRRGAFSGAVADKPGLFSVADEGTLLLDEIGELPKSLQVKLLRALQEREFLPVGDTRPQKVNLRVVAATNRDLAADVTAGRFRQDLYYRINVVEIRLPPLRERLEDVPTLARHFIDKHAKGLGKAPRPLTSAAVRSLLQYSWPGNVRELENVIERALILSTDPKKIDVADLPLGVQGPGSGTGAGLPKGMTLDLDEATKQFSRAHILAVLGAVDGDKKEAARVLGVGLSSLYRKIEELGLTTKKSPDEGR